MCKAGRLKRVGIEKVKRRLCHDASFTNTPIWGTDNTEIGRITGFYPFLGEIDPLTLHSAILGLATRSILAD